MTVSAEAPARGGARVAVQKFGTFLSGMIMPNIAAFIAWGLITALFIEKGSFPVAGIGGFGVDARGGERRSGRPDGPVHVADPDRRAGRPDGLRRPRCRGRPWSPPWA